MTSDACVIINRAIYIGGILIYALACVLVPVIVCNSQTRARASSGIIGGPVLGAAAVLNVIRSTRLILNESVDAQFRTNHLKN